MRRSRAVHHPQEVPEDIEVTDSCDGEARLYDDSLAITVVGNPNLDARMVAALETGDIDLGLDVQCVQPHVLVRFGSDSEWVHCDLEDLRSDSLLPFRGASDPVAVLWLEESDGSHYREFALPEAMHDSLGQQFRKVHEPPP